MKTHTFETLKEKLLPKFMTVDGILYNLSAYEIMGGGSYSVKYMPWVEYRGLMQADVHSKRVIDTIYNGTPEEVIEKIHRDLKQIDYTVVKSDSDLLLTNHEKFEKGLKNLIILYKKDGTVPADIMTHYLSMSMRTLNVSLSNLNKNKGLDDVRNGLNDLLADEDLTDQKLQIAAEGLLPSIADVLNKIK